MTIKANNLGCMRSDKYLFRNLNFSVGSGELLRIHGENGSGKTTLLKVLSGLMAPDKGKVTWQNAPISHDYKQEMAYLGHKDGINLNLTVEENVSLQVHLAKATLNREAFLMLLESLSLSSKADLPCYQLSQGQRRKVAICGLLLKRKAVWLLDEPFTSLDKGSIDVVSEQIRVHLLAKGLVIMASHHAVNHSHQVVQL